MFSFNRIVVVEGRGWYEIWQSIFDILKLSKFIDSALVCKSEIFKFGNIDKSSFRY